MVREFQAAVKNKISSNPLIRDSYGLSNIGRFIVEGLLVGVPNLDAVDHKTESLLLCTRICLSPEIEFHIALFLHQGMTELRQYMENMTATAVTDDYYSNRNNNVSIYLATDGKVYVHNKKPSGDSSNLMNEIIRRQGQGIEPDGVYFSIYKPNLSTRVHPSVQGIIDQLSQMVGQRNLHEVLVPEWEEFGEVPRSMRRLPTSIPFQDISAGVENLGGKYSSNLLAKFHAGLNFLHRKHFVILSGVSGSGKTSLAINYSKAIHGISGSNIIDPLFFMCAVRPDWTDPSGLLGYFDVFSEKYIVPTFLQAVFAAQSYPDAAVFVCLDEMNIARVEYYLADVLSAMETGLPLNLHSNAAAFEGDSGCLVPASTYWPNNLYIIGTINIDETTSPLSDKVLDRAVLIDMSNIELEAMLDLLVQRSSQLSGAVQASKDILVKVYQILANHQQPFGYRMVEEVIKYVHFSSTELGFETPESAIDAQMVQKVFSKLKGTESQRELLVSLSALVNNFPESSALIKRLISELNEYGSFQANR